MRTQSVTRLRLIVLVHVLVMMIYLGEGPPTRLVLHQDVLVLPTVDHIFWDEIVSQTVLYGGVPLVHDLLHDR